MIQAAYLKGELYEAGLDELFRELEGLRPEWQQPALASEASRELFRLLHSIKSMAGLGNLSDLEQEAHGIESLLAHGQADALASRLELLASRWQQREWLIQVPPPAVPDHAGPVVFQVACRQWQLDAAGTEKVWSQVLRSQEVLCVSAWVDCPGEVALTRVRLLLAKLEDACWVLDSRSWNPASREGPVRPDRLDQTGLAGDCLYFQALVVLPPGMVWDGGALMPDQVRFWSCWPVDADLFQDPDQSAGAPGLLLYVRDQLAVPRTGGPSPGRAANLDGLLRQACLDQARTSAGLGQPLKDLAQAVFAPIKDRVRLFLSVDEVPLPPRAGGLLIEAMVHLLRNILAHAVEPPEVRRRLYKAPETSVCLHLQRDGDRLAVLLWDDGAGMTAAGQLAGPSGDSGSQLDEAGGLLFQGQDWGRDVMPLLEEEAAAIPVEAGLVSGRGVGLASAAFIVRQLLQGELACFSRPGTGTCFLIRIPRILVQAEYAVFRWYEAFIALPLNQLLCVQGKPLLLAGQVAVDQVKWAGHACRIANPVPLLDLEAQGARAVLDRTGQRARWVGEYRGTMTAVFPRDANAVYSSLAAAWVELLDF